MEDRQLLVPAAGPGLLLPDESAVVVGGDAAACTRSTARKPREDRGRIGYRWNGKHVHAGRAPES